MCAPPLLKRIGSDSQEPWQSGEQSVVRRAEGEESSNPLLPVALKHRVRDHGARSVERAVIASEDGEKIAKGSVRVGCLGAGKDNAQGEQDVQTTERTMRVVPGRLNP